MEPLILKNKEVYPLDEILENVLKGSYPAFLELRDNLSGLGIKFEWNYYNDGKAWLCKMLLKKKNLGWVGVFDGFFSTTFYFMEKHLESIADLDITEDIKNDFCQSEFVSKLKPLRFNIHNETQLTDVYTVIEFKKGLK